MHSAHVTPILTATFVLWLHHKYFADMFFAYGSWHLSLWWSAISLLNVFYINVECIWHIWHPSSHLPFVLSLPQKYCADMFFAYGSCHFSLWWSHVSLPNMFNINVECIRHIWHPCSHLPFVLSLPQKYCADMFFAYGSCHLSLRWSAVRTPSGHHGHPWRLHMVFMQTHVW
jgi:hypothetical protein